MRKLHRSYDFVFDACANGQQLKCLTVVDEFSRESLAIDVADSIRIRSGRVIEVLSQLLSVRGAPRYALSDPAMEEALVDTPVMRRFARIGGMEDTPDETTILNFRRLLERHGLAEKLFKQVNAHLQRKGLSLRSGTIPAFARTDATKQQQFHRLERWKASVRAKVEHPFLVIKRQFGYAKVRYRCIAKNAAQVLTLFALSNLWMSRRHSMPAAG